MKYLISEQQYIRILDAYKIMIKNVLNQNNVEVSDLSVTPIYFPERGLEVSVKLEDINDKSLVKDLIKDLISNLDIFGEKKKLKISS